MDKKKGATVIGGLLALLGLGYLVTRKPAKPEPPEGEMDADIVIEVYDAAGKLVPKNSPVSLAEGQTYTVTPRVRNKSIKRTAAGDIPIAATFGIGVVVNIGSWYPPNLGGVAQNLFLVAFAADETRLAVFPSFTVPVGAGGQTGKILCEVYAPTGEFLKSAQEPITVAPPVVATGKIEYLKIYYAGIPTGTWEDFASGRQVPAGVPISLGIGWRNLSSFNIIGHIDLVLGTAPLTAILNQDKEAAPMLGHIVQFSPVTLSTEGTHTFTATLSSGGKVLNANIFTLVTVAQIIYDVDITFV